MQSVEIMIDIRKPCLIFHMRRTSVLLKEYQKVSTCEVLAWWWAGGGNGGLWERCGGTRPYWPPGGV